MILWRRLDQPGHDTARLLGDAALWQIMGTAVFAQEGQPCRLDYLVAGDAGWRTRSARVAGWLGERSIAVEITADEGRRWRLNGVEQPAVSGCIDLDLSFTPATNLLPIRRLGLAIGEQARITSAWLRFPELTLAPLEQLYHRTGPSTYHYEVFGVQFTATLVVNEAGFVVDYPGLWVAEAKI